MNVVDFNDNNSHSNYNNNDNYSSLDFENLFNVPLNISDNKDSDKQSFNKSNANVSKLQGSIDNLDINELKRIYETKKHEHEAQINNANQILNNLKVSLKFYNEKVNSLPIDILNKYNISAIDIDVDNIDLSNVYVLYDALINAKDILAAHIKQLYEEVRQALDDY